MPLLRTEIPRDVAATVAAVTRWDFLESLDNSHALDAGIVHDGIRYAAKFKRNFPSFPRTLMSRSLMLRSSVADIRFKSIASTSSLSELGPGDHVVKEFGLNHAGVLVGWIENQLDPSRLRPFQTGSTVYELRERYTEYAYARYFSLHLPPVSEAFDTIRDLGQALITMHDSPALS